MLTIVIGGSGSGKSEFAEQYVVDLKTAHRFYVAAMHPYGEEGAKRVMRHRKLRSGKGFVTIEKYINVGELVFPAGSSVLLECLSNLTANEMFDDNSKDPLLSKKILKKLSGDLAALERHCEHLVIVTNDVFSDGGIYEEETLEYMRVLGMLHRVLAKRADEIIEVTAGIPDYWRKMR